MNNIMRLI